MPKNRLIIVWTASAVLALLAGIAVMNIGGAPQSVAAMEAQQIRGGILFAAAGAAAALALAQALGWTGAETGEEVDDAAHQVERAEPGGPRDGDAEVADIVSISTGMQSLLAEIEHAYDSQQRLIRGIGHDLRSPLASIVSMSDSLAGGELGAVSDEQAEACRLLGDTARRLIGQIEVLYALSEGRDCVSSQCRECFEINSLALRVAAGLRPWASAKGVELAVDVPDKPTTVQSDQTAIERIVANLVDNAVKFTDEGSVTLSMQTNDGCLRIMVVDTGIGIAQDEIGLLTEEYFRSPSVADRDGTGIGLSVIKELAEQLGGSLAIESVKGEGSTFTVKVPVEPAAEMIA